MAMTGTFALSNLYEGFFRERQQRRHFWIDVVIRIKKLI